MFDNHGILQSHGDTAYRTLYGYDSLNRLTTKRRASVRPNGKKYNITMSLRWNIKQFGATPYVI